jgi:hypothetical protein
MDFADGKLQMAFLQMDFADGFCRRHFHGDASWRYHCNASPLQRFTKVKKVK